ncbi:MULTISPECIES: hypothetical protein [unclassified Flavobacterium]|uniref:hypothetical protein n=1 Tax=unclassified Flavobacterium TaxID=196869 RepID=UPI00361BFC2E
MKENNYIRVKIYFLIFIVAFTFGWIASKSEITMVVEGRDIYSYGFNYAMFGLLITLGFTITLVYDIYILGKNKKESSDRMK